MLVRRPHDLAGLFRDGRARAGWSQNQLAEAVGVSRQWISLVETGKTSVEFDLVVAALEALGYRLLGEDCAGAVQFVRPERYDEVVDAGQGLGSRSHWDAETHSTRPGSGLEGGVGSRVMRIGVASPYSRAAASSDRISRCHVDPAAVSRATWSRSGAATGCSA